MVIGKCSDTQEDGVRALPTLPVPDKSTQIELNLGSLLKGGGSTLKYSERSYPFSSLSPQISGRGLKSRFAITSNKEYQLDQRSKRHPKIQWLVSMHAQYYLTLCNPMDCRWPGSSVDRIFQARILEQVVNGLKKILCCLVIGLQAGRPGQQTDLLYKIIEIQIFFFHPVDPLSTTEAVLLKS